MVKVKKRPSLVASSKANKIMNSHHSFEWKKTIFCFHCHIFDRMHSNAVRDENLNRSFSIEFCFCNPCFVSRCTHSKEPCKDFEQNWFEEIEFDHQESVLSTCWTMVGLKTLKVKGGYLLTALAWTTMKTSHKLAQ